MRPRPGPHCKCTTGAPRSRRSAARCGLFKLSLTIGLPFPRVWRASRWYVPRFVRLLVFQAVWPLRTCSDSPTTCAGTKEEAAAGACGRQEGARCLMAPHLLLLASVTVCSRSRLLRLQTVTRCRRALMCNCVVALACLHLSMHGACRRSCPTVLA